MRESYCKKICRIYKKIKYVCRELMEYNLYTGQRWDEY